VQFKQTRGYLSQTCGFPALKDRVVVIVDASDLTFEAHNEVWKGDREHVRDTIVGERYKDAVTAAIKESKALQDLQNEVALEELKQAASSERNNLFQKLVDSDRNLAALLTNRDPVITLPSAGGGGNGSDPGQGDFVGKFSPTHLKFDDKVRQTGFSLPINRSRPIVARTDAENGYLQRADNRGRLLIEQAVYDRFGVRAQLHNGRLTLYLDPIEDKLKVGDAITLKVGLQDDAMPQPVADKITVHIVDQEKEPKKAKAKAAEPKAAAKGSKEGEGDSSPTHGLPPFVLLTRDGHQIGNENTQPWPDGFTEFDGGLVEDLGENGTLYKINYENAYHVRYRMGARGDIARDVVTEKYILGMRILMLGYEHALRAIGELKGSPNGIAEFQDEFRRLAARGAASTVLALAENLPKIIDKTSLSANQDVE
jgi:hypothetical protein